MAPVKPSGSATFTEKVAYDHRMVQYNKELERWKAAMTHQTKVLLLFLLQYFIFLIYFFFNVDSNKRIQHREHLGYQYFLFLGDFRNFYFHN